MNETNITCGHSDFQRGMRSHSIQEERPVWLEVLMGMFGNALS